jgi:hypothetical protein
MLAALTEAQADFMLIGGWALPIHTDIDKKSGAALASYRRRQICTLALEPGSGGLGLVILVGLGLVVVADQAQEQRELGRVDSLGCSPLS